jgi:hypothetical protein
LEGLGAGFGATFLAALATGFTFLATTFLALAGADFFDFAAGFAFATFLVALAGAFLVFAMIEFILNLKDAQNYGLLVKTKNIIGNSGLSSY